MKKYFVFIFLAVSFITLLYFLSNFFKNNNLPAINTTSITSTPAIVELSLSPRPTFYPGVDISGFRVAWIIVRDFEKLKLMSNLEDAKTSTELLINNNCLYLVSGGFFDQEGNHIGLFISDGVMISSSQENSLFNAYFSLSNNLKPLISKKVPASAGFAVQSGPLIYSGGKVININPDNEESARRIIVATTDRNEIVFLVFYSSLNTLSGPKLNELPGLIKNLNESTSLKIKDALNLDGGSHSAFLEQNLKLSEIAKIGSFFCIKP